MSCDSLCSKTSCSVATPNRANEASAPLAPEDKQIADLMQGLNAPAIDLLLIWAMLNERTAAEEMPTFG